ncbi:MAG: YraN family protein [Candidatus Liptonbacteria bacterium]|nr:YraN family protein [Candidatus Liptonbacteria bacterium]
MFSGEISKKSKHLSTGKIGEDLACAYLVKKGYTILSRNYKEKWDEIDIIGKNSTGTLVFFEVKTLTDKSQGLVPEDNMTQSKLKKLRRACQMFAGKQPGLINNNVGWRIDLVAIVLTGPNPRKDHVIRHYENI